MLTMTGTYTAVETEVWEFSEWPLGAHVDANGSDTATFAVFSERATRIMLEIYNSPIGEEAIASFWMIKNNDDNVWRAKITGIKPNTYYAFRCWGPNWEWNENWRRGNSNVGFITDADNFGNRFNPNKVLFDPYAREISHDKESKRMLDSGNNASMYGTGGEYYNNVPRRNVDTGRWAPKSILIQDDTDTGDRPYIAERCTSIYEAHIGYLTQHNSVTRLKDILQGINGFEMVENIPAEYRGTYVGAKMMAPYIKGLGINAIEFLPVHETCNENIDWGYMTYGFFAPDRRYAYDKSPGGPTREFKEMVKAFHELGIEVYIDVVYNHTGEGGHWNNDFFTTGFLCFGGFDNYNYYQLNNNWLDQGATGCGNQLDFSTEITRKLVVDSLKFWITDMGVDGFRFDLAPVLGRTPDYTGDQFHTEHALLREIRTLANDYDVTVVAEAWDLWGVKIGEFPYGWAEWNGNYRDGIRKFLKGDGNTSWFVNMLNGDYMRFNDQGGAQKSVNFVDAHDGFTMTDLVSYNNKNNYQDWPFGNSDGGNDNNSSWDSGGNHELRRKRLRNFWSVLYISRGVPMVVYGDEFGRTQNGNNNPYNLNTPATWNNYGFIASNSPNQLNTEEPGIGYHNNLGTAYTDSNVNPIFRFAQYMIRLRAAHIALRQNNYGDHVIDDNDGDVSYIFRKTDGYCYLGDNDRCVWLRIDGSSVEDHDFLVMINMYHEPVSFTVPWGSDTQVWKRIVDTSVWAEYHNNCWNVTEADRIVGSYTVDAWAITILEEVSK